MGVNRASFASARSLVAGEAVDVGGRGTGQGDAVGLVRDTGTGQVGDVLTKRELTVDRRAGQRLVAGVLGDQTGGTFLEVLPVLRGPPVAQVAGGVVLAALVVESVADLVPDHCPDGPVVDRIVGGRFEER